MNIKTTNLTYIRKPKNWRIYKTDVYGKYISKYNLSYGRYIGPLQTVCRHTSVRWAKCHDMTRWTETSWVECQRLTEMVPT